MKSLGEVTLRLTQQLACVGGGESKAAPKESCGVICAAGVLRSLTYEEDNGRRSVSARGNDLQANQLVSRLYTKSVP